VFRSVLVALKPGGSNDAVVSHAVMLAAAHGWRLEGLAVVDPDRVAPPEPVPLGATAFKTRRDEALFERASAAAATTLQEFSRACQQGGIQHKTVGQEGDLAASVARAVEEHDALLLGHNIAGKAGDALDRSPLHEILKHCARPALVVPRACRAGTTIVAAYDGSLQAARALQAFAASGLAQRGPVCALSLAGDPQEAAATAARAAHFLRLHGILAETHSGDVAPDTATVILEQCLRRDAGLLVMGAYGRPTIREFFFGSVTRSVLERVDIPVFISQ
jgi:nucleotide-binding universal stress UspA family protein